MISIHWGGEGQPGITHHTQTQGDMLLISRPKENGGVETEDIITAEIIKLVKVMHSAGSVGCHVAAASSLTSHSHIFFLMAFCKHGNCIALLYSPFNPHFHCQFLCPGIRFL